MSEGSRTRKGRGAEVMALGGWLLAGTVASAQVVAPLDYAPRGGGRQEGLRTIPVAGYDLELLSAHVVVSDIKDEPPLQTRWGDQVRLWFYLPDDGKVFITARQLDSRSTYYWLNYAGGSFQARTVNPYGWPTEPVLRQLPQRYGVSDPRDLGVTVRLGGPSEERVLPALVEGSLGPASRAAYEFTLKTNSRTNVAATVYAEDRDDAVFKWPGGWRPANRPFVVKWDAAASPEGWYRLVFSGYFENNSQVGKTVHFYHRPDLLTRPPGR